LFRSSFISFSFILLENYVYTILFTPSFILKFADDKASNLPHAPIAEMITLVTADGVGLLTPQCVSMVELNAQIDFRIAELEGIREEASGKFAIDLRRHSAKA